MQLQPYTRLNCRCRTYNRNGLYKSYHRRVVVFSAARAARQTSTCARPHSLPAPAQEWAMRQPANSRPDDWSERAAESTALASVSPARLRDLSKVWLWAQL